MNTIIVHPDSEEKWKALKAVMKALNIEFEFSSDKTPKYNAEFVSKIKKSKKEAQQNKITRVPKKDLKKFLEL